MTAGLPELAIAICAILIGIYYYLTSNFNFWKSQGVPGPQPKFFYGTTKRLFRAEESWGHHFQSIYKKYIHEPIVGIYMFQHPCLVIQDLDLVKTILIKDFSNFIDRDVNREPANPLNDHLFFIEAKKWRPLRTKLSPVFTSGKLRDMFHLLNQCADNLGRHLDQVAGQCVDMRDIAAKYTTDTIGMCAFGIDANAIDKEDNIFRTMGKRSLHLDWKRLLKQQLGFFVLPLAKVVGGVLEDWPMIDFFTNLTRDTIKYRKDNNIHRPDFIDLLRSLKEEPSKIDDIELTDSLMAAQLFVFFVAGFETSSSTISNCLLELAINPEVQAKLRAEIRKELGDSAAITYDHLKRMQYLDMVVKETLRKYPPVPFLMRMAEKKYTIPGTKVQIPPLTKVIIPVYAIQRDPQYYPKPEVFDPERFNEENEKLRHPMAYLPFGDGPRNCIGARFGGAQSKVALIKIIQKFSVDVCGKTDKNYEHETQTVLLAPKNGVVIKLTKCLS